MKGDFAHYVDDPYVEPGFTRAPLDDEVEVVVIGGGFGGLLAGARLREAGVDDIRIIEKGGDFGGTWYWNRYPGAMCDVESYIYLPLLEELGYVPKREVRARAGDPRAQPGDRRARTTSTATRCFQTEVTEMRWDEAARAGSSRPTAATGCGRASSCMANGPLNRPKLPGIPGIESFAGHTFHTSRWDYALHRRRLRTAA